MNVLSPFHTHKALDRKAGEGKDIGQGSVDTGFSIVQVLHNPPQNDLLYNLHCAFHYLWTGSLSGLKAWGGKGGEKNNLDCSEQTLEIWEVLMVSWLLSCLKNQDHLLNLGKWNPIF